MTSNIIEYIDELGKAQDQIAEVVEIAAMCAVAPIDDAPLRCFAALDRLAADALGVIEGLLAQIKADGVAAGEVRP